MEKTKIGVIGLGGIAQLVHLPILSKMENVKIVAVSEINKNRLNTVADKFNINERFLDYKDLIKNSDCDAVIISTPTSTHKTVAIDCLNAKKNILVEKPIGRTVEEAKAIVDASKKNKKLVMVGMNLRYRPDIMLLKSIINAGEIGSPIYIKLSWIKSQSSSGKWFTKKEEAGGGVIFDLGIMLLDLGLWFLDFPPIKTVSAQNYMQNTKTVEDTSVSFIRCKYGSLLNIETSWSLVTEKDSFSLTVFGNNGSAMINPLRIYKKINNEIVTLTPSQGETSTSLYKKSYFNELKHFIGSVQGLHPVMSSGEEAIKRMEVLEKMYESAAEGKEIKL